VLSKPEVYSRLANHFVGLRFDWEQGNHYKDRFKFILGTGDQMLLTPGGDAIRHDEPTKDGRPNMVYGRHGLDTTAKVLDAVMAKHPVKSEQLKFEWFLWSQKPTRRPGGMYPASHTSIAGYARLPFVLVNGPIPTALNDANFLRWHVRQFIWVRGRTNGASELVVRRVKDGLKAGLSAELATLNPESLTWKELGQGLDSAWFDYMKNRPLTAKGYLDNPYGKWMRSVASQMIDEEATIRKRALDGTLLAPGRMAGEAAPYLNDAEPRN
jgi:hypothetical protein